MKNKKGFTLVELLAVIAILAVLVIMALPAVLRMFNSARKDSFTNEVNTVIRTARQQYLLSGGQDTTWSNASGTTNTLSLTGNSHLQYYVKMNNEGKITKLQVSNGDYQYNVTNNAGIDVASSNDVEEVTEENQIVITGVSDGIKYAYSVATFGYGIGDTATINNINVFENYQDAVNKFGRPFFIRYTLEDYIRNNETIWCLVGSDGSNSCSEETYIFDNEENCNNMLQSYASESATYTCNTQLMTTYDGIVTEIYGGFLVDNNIYYIKAVDLGEYETNKAIITDAFNNYSCNEGTNFIKCQNSEVVVQDTSTYGEITFTDIENIHVKCYAKEYSYCMGGVGYPSAGGIK